MRDELLIDQHLAQPAAPAGGLLERPLEVGRSEQARLDDQFAEPLGAWLQLGQVCQDRVAVVHHAQACTKAGPELECRLVGFEQPQWLHGQTVGS